MCRYLALVAMLSLVTAPAAYADSDTGLSLRGTTAFDETGRSMNLEVTFLPLEIAMDPHVLTPYEHDSWDVLYERGVGRLPYAGEYQHAPRVMEVFGARILQTAVRYDIAGADSLFDLPSALVLEWQSGAIGLVYESETDLGFLTRLKVEGRKHTNKDPYFLQRHPLGPLDVEVDTRVLVEVVYR